jgi:hypothetical protein
LLATRVSGRRKATYGPVAYALYRSVAIEVTQRFSHHFMAMGSYTYSKTWDTATDFKAVAANICGE